MLSIDNLPRLGSWWMDIPSGGVLVLALDLTGVLSSCESGPKDFVLQVVKQENDFHPFLACYIDGFMRIPIDGVSMVSVAVGMALSPDSIGITAFICPAGPVAFGAMEQKSHPETHRQALVALLACRSVPWNLRWD